jgi:S1-C subfamily serine protease
MNPLTDFSQALSALVAEAGKSIVSIHGNRYAASGIHWQTGLIVTSYESVNLEDQIHATLPDGTVTEIEVLGSDPTTDTLVLQLPQAIDLPAPGIAESTILEIGSLVLGLGRSPESSLFASLGIIQTLGPSWRSSSGGVIDRQISPDLNLGRKGAGGPLIDSEGNVVGFNTFGPRRRILTIPSSTVNRVLSQLRDKGRVTRPYLGIGLQSIQIPPALQSQLSVAAECGLMVVSVEPEQAAERAGILLGDILVALNNTSMKDSRAFQLFLASQPIGQTLTVQLIRGGEQRQLDVIVGER